jgi:glycosyltransferase involved in cell wall biosynthesis
MRLSCIIPAFNEAARICDVLACVVDHPLIDEVIVIDDGSADGTSAVVAAIAGVRLVTLPRNRGKTAALAEGIARAKGTFLLLVDADLVGLSPADLTALIDPVLTGRADLSISLRRNAPLLWRRIGLDYISGERVLQKALIAPEVGQLEHLPKFGFEVFLNGLAIAATQRIAVVHWPEVASPLKAVKYGWSAGLRADVGMMRDLFQAVPGLGLLRQIIALRRLRVLH